MLKSKGTTWVGLAFFVDNQKNPFALLDLGNRDHCVAQICVPLVSLRLEELNFESHIDVFVVSLITSEQIQDIPLKAFVELTFDL